jgi:hypothetical protein
VRIRILSLLARSKLRASLSFWYPHAFLESSFWNVRETGWCSLLLSLPGSDKIFHVLCTPNFSKATPILSMLGLFLSAQNRSVQISWLSIYVLFISAGSNSLFSLSLFKLLGLFSTQIHKIWEQPFHFLFLSLPDKMSSKSLRQSSCFSRSKSQATLSSCKRLGIL